MWYKSVMRSRNILSYLPGIILVLTGIALLFPGAVFQNQVLYPGDLLFAYEPWHMEFTPQGGRSSNWILFDEVLEFHPWREHLRSSLLAGTVPLWDPTCFCGYPFAGLFQTALLYLPDRIMDILPFRHYPLTRAAFHFLVAGLGCMVFLRRRDCFISASLFGSVGYAFCGFMIVWLGHPHIKAAAWLPWIYIGIDICLARPVRGMVALTAAGSMTLVAGHAETALHIATTAFIYLILRVALDSRPRKVFKRLGALFGAGLTVFLIAGGMILPFGEYLVRSVAYAVRSDGVVVQAHFDGILALTHLIPKLFGSSADGTHWYPEFNSAELGGAFFGVLTLSLALSSIAGSNRRKQKIIHGIIIVFCLGVVYGIFPIYQMAGYLPGYKMSYNFRLVLPLAFSMIALASFGLDDLLERHRTALTAGTVTAVVLAAGILVVPLWIHRFPYAPGTIRAGLMFKIIPAVLPLLLFWPAAAAFFHGKIRRSILGGLAVTVVLGELVWFGRDFNPTVSASMVNPEPASASRLNALNEIEPFRVLPVGMTYPPHTALNFGIHDIRGNDALTPLNVEDYVSAGDPAIRAPRMLPALRMMWINHYASTLWDTLNVKYLVFPLNRPPPAEPHLVFESVRGGAAIFRNDRVMPRAFVTGRWSIAETARDATGFVSGSTFRPREESVVRGITPPPSRNSKTDPGTARITRYEPHFVSIESKGSGIRLLVLSDTYFPGWTARMDGRIIPIFETNRMMRGVFVPGGDHRVDFSYRPVSYLFGMFLTCTGILIFFSFLSGGLPSGLKHRVQPD